MRGRPKGSSCLASIDDALLAATKRASDKSGLSIAKLIRINVALCGARLGASREAAIKRLQGKARVFYRL
jgi:hypothetical protein